MAALCFRAFTVEDFIRLCSTILNSQSARPASLSIGEKMVAAFVSVLTFQPQA